MKQYYYFDKRCQKLLRKMAIFINRRGEILQKEGLSKWFKNLLKPTPLKAQNERLAVKCNNNRLIRLAFF